MNQYIDHTILKQTATPEDVAKVCEEAHKHQFATVCIPPCWVKFAKQTLAILANPVTPALGVSNVGVCTVIGFPFGYSTTHTKVEEIIQALEDGADELDIVQNVSMVKCGDFDYINNEIYACLQAVYRNFSPRPNIPIVKVILESGVLTDEEIVRCCEIYSAYSKRTHVAPITFIKTSTGYAEKGASVHQVDVIKAHIPNNMKIKASGGIRNYTFAKELVDAGATRLGCSAGVQIMNEYANREKEGIFPTEEDQVLGPSTY